MFGKHVKLKASNKEYIYYAIYITLKVHPLSSILSEVFLDDFLPTLDVGDSYERENSFYAIQREYSNK